MRTLLVVMGILSSLSLMACGSNGNESGATAQNDGRVDCGQVWNQYVAGHPAGMVEEYSVTQERTVDGRVTRQPPRRTTTRVVSSSDAQVTLNHGQADEPMTKEEFLKSCQENGMAGIPAEAKVEVQERSRKSVTVPAGTFECDYVRAKVTMSGMEMIVQTWTDRSKGSLVRQESKGEGRGMQMTTVSELVRRG